MRANLLYRRALEYIDVKIIDQSDNHCTDASLRFQKFFLFRSLLTFGTLTFDKIALSTAKKKTIREFVNLEMDSKFQKIGKKFF